MNQLSLDGTWKLRWSDGQRGRPEYAECVDTDDARYIDAAVPGEVHLDLLRAGLIPDPYVHAQAKDSRWVEDCVWSYRRFFDAPPEALTGRAWLCFEALDLTARIVLNGETVGTHGNVFRPCRVEVTGKLKEGRNLLTVHLDAGLLAVSEKPHSGYVYQGFDQHLHKRHWLRKPQSQFSWDWSPRLINIGIGGSAMLEWTGDAVRLDEFSAWAEVSDDLERGTVRGRFFLEPLAAGATEAVLALWLDGGPRVEKVVHLHGEAVCGEVELSLDYPRLWWPVGHGGQELYTLRGEVSVGGRSVASVTRRVGFRRVRVNQEPHPDGGRYFVFEINHRPIFLKGANLVPADLIFARTDRARYEALVSQALAANFNFLRVWGGGLYESEDFYDLCDERGVLVWQEFIYACGKYPLHDEAFFAEARREAVYQVRRLAPRPSLVAWCGNNEIDMFNDWPGSDRGLVRPDYAFFHLTLRQIVRAEHPGCYYQPSSPASPDGLPPNRDDIGDQHPWSIGFHNVDFHGYRPMTCRFPNEGGFLGPTALPTVLACLPEGQRHIGSFAWQYHDNSVDSWAEPSPVDAITQEWIGREARDLSVEEFVYRGGLLQGEALREYIEAFRRKMFGSACACFWMFNDCWPATRSWTVIDYHLRRTPSFHAVRRAFAPVHVALALEEGEVRVYGINEHAAARPLRLRFGVFTLAGGYPRDEEREVVLPPNAATRLAAFPAAMLEAAAHEAGAFAVLSEGGQVVARNRLFLARFKAMAWRPAEVKLEMAGGVARFSSPGFVWGVCLDLDGSVPLADNFFDLYPGMDHLVPWPHAEEPRVLHTGELGPRA